PFNCARRGLLGILSKRNQHLERSVPHRWLPLQSNVDASTSAVLWSLLALPERSAGDGAAVPSPGSGAPVIAGANSSANCRVRQTSLRTFTPRDITTGRGTGCRAMLGFGDGPRWQLGAPV